MVDNLGEHCVGALCQWFHLWILQFHWLLLIGGIDDTPFFWFMWPLSVAIDGGRYLLSRPIVDLVHVAKYPFFIDWMMFLLTGLNSVA